ncbi:unnamed protein product [Prunus armeniaca]
MGDLSFTSFDFASFAVFDTRGLDVWLADNSIGDIVNSIADGFELITAHLSSLDRA